MKRTLMMTLCVLAVALAVCAGSMLALNGTVERARRLQSLAMLAVQEGRPDDAGELLVSLAELWRDRAPLLETPTNTPPTSPPQRAKLGKKWKTSSGIGSASDFKPPYAKKKGESNAFPFLFNVG